MVRRAPSSPSSASAFAAATVVAAVLGGLAVPARADVVELRNGTTLEGEVVAETETSVTLRFQGGQVTFERKLVAAIRKEPKPEPPRPEEKKPGPPGPEVPLPDGPQFVPPTPSAPKGPKANPPRPDPSSPGAPRPDVLKPDPAAPARSPFPAPSSITPAKDDWTLLWSADRRTGWCRAQAKVDDAGTSIFEWEITDLGLDGRPAGTMRYVEEAGPGFSPLGFLLATDTPARQSSRSGRIRDGRLVVETWENGEKTLRDYPAPEGMRLPLAARAVVLREAAGTGASWQGPTFDPRTGEFTTAKISLLRRERFSFEGTDVDTVVLTRSLGAVTTEERVSADGRVLAAGSGPDGDSAVGTTAARVEALRTASTEEEASETEMRGRMSMACPEDGFRIRKPGVSWVLVPAESKTSRDRAGVKDFSGTVGVVVASDPAPAGPEPTPADLGAALEERLRKESAEFSLVESGAAALGGSPGWRLLADTRRNGDPVRILVHVLARGGRVHTVTAAAPRPAFAEARPYLQRILDGIEWL